MPSEIEIPAAFASSTIAREGERGRAWIDDLPTLIDELLQRWNCTPAAPATHGHVGIVVPVRPRDLPPAVLKISFPHPGNVHEPDAFAAWAGRGAVQLYQRDDERFAMLLEQVTTEMLAVVEDADERLTIAGRLSRRLAIPAPAQLPRLRDQVDHWVQTLRDQSARLHDPLPTRVLAAAMAAVRELGADQPDVLVHGDLHYANILRAQREPWLVIDPKGYAGDPAYDTNTVIAWHYWTAFAEPDPRSALLRCIAVFAEGAEIDRDRAVRWTQARAVTAALWGRSHGDPDWLIDANDQVAALLAHAGLSS